MSDQTFTYVRNQELLRLPRVAAERKRLADAYRKMRKANPAIARLVYRRTQRAVQSFADDVFGQGTTTGQE